MSKRMWLCAVTFLIAGPICYGEPSSGPEQQQRAGYPQSVAPWAQPSDTGRYDGYYVGGGSANFRKGELPCADEGTWGWDFFGGFFRRRVDLLWWHGQRQQGGTGAYKTDGPHILPRIE